MLQFYFLSLCSLWGWNWSNQKIPEILLPVNFHLSEVSLSRVFQMSSFQVTLSSFSWRNLVCSQTGYNLSEQWRKPSKVRRLGGICQIPESTQLAPFDTGEQRLYSEPLLDIWAPFPCSKAELHHRGKSFQSVPRPHDECVRWMDGEIKSFLFRL